MTDMQFETVGTEHPIRAADLGSGPAVVLLHGFPDTPQSWASTAQLLAEAGFRVIVAYLRGYHPDTIIEGRAYGAAQLGEDVVAILDAFDLESAVLVGHDWGASCVWNAVEMAPDRIDAVVSIAIPHPGKVKPSPKLLWMARHFFGLKLPGAAKRVARKNCAYLDMIFQRWSPDWTGPEQQATVARAKQAFSDPTVADHAIRWYGDLDLRPDRAPVKELGVKGLMVAGSHDFGGDMAPYRATVEALMDGSELLVVEGAGHWPHREGADQFHEALLRFLTND